MRGLTHMVAQPEETGPPFKDYFLILQLHPEADAEMVDAAYWHLARRYSDARRTDPSAKAKMDDLNEAYSVLRSSTRREEYSSIRNAVLGEGALPSPPQPVPEAPPLAVMEKQRPEPRKEDATAQPRGGPTRRFAQVSVPSWQSALVAILILVLGGAALVAGAHPTMVAGLLVIAVALATLPLLRKLPGPHSLPRLALRLPRMRGLPRESSAKRRPDADAIRESTEQMRSRLRQVGETEAPSTVPSVEATPNSDLAEDPDGGSAVA